MVMRAAGLLSAFLLGLLCGTMLHIAVAFVPFWRALPAGEFRVWFTAYSFPIGMLVFSLAGAATVAAVAALFAGLRSPSRTHLGVAAAAALGVSMVTLFVTEPANILFVTPGAITDAETEALLQRWIWWHWGRLTLCFVGFAASVCGLAQNEDVRPRRPTRRRRKR